MPSVIYKNQQPSVKELRHILGNDGFKNPKDPEVVGRLVKLIAPDDGIVLDPMPGPAQPATPLSQRTALRLRNADSY